MASTYTGNGGLEKIGTGEQAGTWGTTSNTNLDLVDRMLNGVTTLTITGDRDLVTSDGTLADGHHKVLLLAGTPGAGFTIEIKPNDQQKFFFIKNSTGQLATFTQGSGANATVANGASAILAADGAGSSAVVTNIGTDVLSDASPQLGGNLDVNTKNINFGDSATAGSDDTLQFGASQDLKIFHDGSNSQIRDSGTGSLKIGGSQVDIVSDDAGESMATFVDNGAATLFHDNSAKIATSSAGVTVTGVMSASTGITIGSAVVTEAQLEILDGATLSTTELNFVDGVTSALQTQLDAKARGFTAGSTLTSSATLTATQSNYQRVDCSGGDVTVTVAVGSGLTVGDYVVIDKIDTSSNNLTVAYTSNSQGVSLGTSVDLAVAFFNGTHFSFTETIKS
tara:strand:- start:300 stop:1484 length:1185 start_codon:yes stop_codon:yes gene_type:complete